MGFFSKNRARNRRVSRDVVLNVKLSNDQVRSRRMNIAARVLMVLFCVAFAGFVFFRGGQWLTNRLMYENPAFTVRKVDVTTDGVMTHAEIRRFVILRPNQNLYALDLAAVKRDLEMLPWIRHAFVERVLPETLRIQVEEREPVAEIRRPVTTPRGELVTQRLLVDDSGFVMPALDGWIKHVNTSGNVDQVAFPQMMMNLTDVVEGRRLEVVGVTSAIELLKRFELSSMAGVVDILSIDITQPDELMVTTVQGTKVTFAIQFIDRQLLRWREIHDRLAASRVTAASINLTVANHIPVIPAELTRQPENPSRPKPVRPPRRRNV